MLELLWRLVDKRPSGEVFTKRMRSLADADVRLLALQYLNVRYAIMQAIWEHKKDAGASEDVLEDLADWLILGGGAALEATLSGAPPVPPRETWGELEDDSLFYALYEEVERRFKKNIYDVTGHTYPYPWTTSSEFKHVDYLGLSQRQS